MKKNTDTRTRKFRTSTKIDRRETMSKCKHIQLNKEKEKEKQKIRQEDAEHWQKIDKHKKLPCLDTKIFNKTLKKIQILTKWISLQEHAEY